MDNSIVLIVVIITSYIYFMYKNSENEQKYFNLKSELDTKINKLNTVIEEKPTVQVQAIVTENKSEIQPKNQYLIDPVNARDNAVVDNILYPPLNRMDRPNIDLALANPAIMGYPTRGSPDTYRPLALAKDTITNDTYYLMGRGKYRGSSAGEFYLIPTDKQNRLKIQLLDDKGKQLIKDIYALPDLITIKTGIFKDKEFQIEELKQTDFSGPYI